MVGGVGRGTSTGARSGAVTDSDKPAEAPSSIRLGVIVAPGLARDVVEGIAEKLLEDLRERYGEVDWTAEFSVDRLVVPPALTTELFAAARRKLLEGDWDLGIVVTDLPLRLGGRHLARHVSPTHGIAVISLPALGPLNLRHRLRRALIDLVEDLVGGKHSNGDGEVFRELASRGHLRLLLGMVRANQPWRFAARLYRVLIAALAVGAYGLLSSDVWRLSDAISSSRLLIMFVASIAATIFAIIAAHRLWERAPNPRVLDQVLLFNVATTASIVIGILTLYAALFFLIFVGAELIISSGLLAREIGHDAGLLGYASLACFVASFATVAGGLGAGLESEDAIREAAYSYTPDTAHTDSG